MDEQPYPPQEPAGPPAGHDVTRPFPTWREEPPATGGFAASSGARGRTGLSAAVLVGALVLGGLAGVGGSMAYSSLHDDGSTGTTPSDTGQPIQATKTVAVPDGTVEKVASAVLPAVVKVNVSGQSESGSGSGIVLTKDGEILTNNHVVAVAGNGGSISVNFNNGATKKARVVGTDPVTDLAVIKADGVSNAATAALGKSGDLRVGQTVVAVGSPFGLNATVTSGIVSALNRPVSVSTQQPGQAQQDPFGLQQPPQSGQQDPSTTYPAIQTDAAINPGNSGGPLVDLSGRVVGINSSIRTSSGSGVGTDSGGSIGLGFAIPIDEVLPIVNQITSNQSPTHARLGVTVSDVKGRSLTQGAQISTVEGSGSAAAAGLKSGDVITKVDDQVIDGSEALVATIRGHRPGDKVTLTYLRGGQTRTTSATLGSDANTKTS